jgi:hypothetical protein
MERICALRLPGRKDFERQPWTGPDTEPMTFKTRAQAEASGRHRRYEFEGREDGGRCGVGCDLSPR